VAHFNANNILAIDENFQPGYLFYGKKEINAIWGREIPRPKYLITTT
jgi:hypothetical protein